MNKIKKFVSNLLKDYFNEEDKKELIEILTQSLEEKIEDLVESGTPVDEAIEQSISEFGDTSDILSAFPEKTQKQKALVAKRKNQLLFSLLGYVLIVGLAIFFNLTFLSFFQNVLWLFVVAIGVFFWPLTRLYFYLAAKK